MDCTSTIMKSSWMSASPVFVQVSTPYWCWFESFQVRNCTLIWRSASIY